MRPQVLRTWLLGAFLLSPSVSSQAHSGNAPLDGRAERTTAAGVNAFGIDLTNQHGDHVYNINVTVGDREFSLLLDTGSSDLVIYTRGQPLKILNDSGLFANESYGDGTVDYGRIQFAEVKVGDFIIPSQAFASINQTNDESPSDGVMGISFDIPSLSPVEHAIQGAWGPNTTLGRTVVANIFSQNSSLSPSYDLAFGRAVDNRAEPTDGSFLIGSHAPGRESVAQAPKLPVAAQNSWFVELDGFSVNGVNYTLPINSNASSTTNKIVALLDSGTTGATMTTDMADFISRGIPGAIQKDGAWLVPCYSSANVTFYFGGQEFPVHPLDLINTKQLNVTLDDGKEFNVTTCSTSSIINQDPPASSTGPIRMILGDLFLKNVYTSYNFGPLPTHFTNVSGAYVQMVSVTDQDAAWTDFLATRQNTLIDLLNIIDPSLLLQLVPDDSPTNSTATSAVAQVPTVTPTSTSISISGALEENREPESMDVTNSGGAAIAPVDKYGPVIVGLLAGSMLVLLILCVIALIACTRGAIRNGPRMRTFSEAPVAFKDKVGEYSEESESVHRYGE